jgi:cell division protein FtsB
MAKNNAIIAKYEDEIKALKQENEALKDKIKALETKE